MSSPSQNDPNISDSDDVFQPNDEAGHLLRHIFMEAAATMAGSMLNNRYHNPHRPFTTMSDDQLIMNWGPLMSVMFQGAAVAASNESIPNVVVKEKGKECGICLEEFLVGDEAKDIPCKHWFHPSCVDKWLQIHGSCPTCRLLIIPSAEEYEDCMS